MTRRSVYLDHSATTPTDPRVVEAMLPYFYDDFGNASSAHGVGRRAERAIEDARETMARIFHCQPKEIVFTSGGTESDNLAVRGVAWAHRERGLGAHLVTTSIEHSAVLKTVQQLTALMGFENSVLAVDRDGMVDGEVLAYALRPDSALVSVIYANNEVGTIQALPQLAAHTRQKEVLFHTDAVQAAGQLPLDVTLLGADLVSISAHKFYGPKGVGALYVRDGVQIAPSQSGGSHEGNLRAGTSNTPGIVGMAKALQIATEQMEESTALYRRLRDQLIDGVLSRISDVLLTGHPQQRLPSHASFVIEGIDSNNLLMHLDLKGVMASSASACKTGNPEPSEVLLAMGYPYPLAMGSVRFSVGRSTTEADIAYTLDTLVAAVERLRKLRLQPSAV